MYSFIVYIYSFFSFKIFHLLLEPLFIYSNKYALTIHYVQLQLCIRFKYLNYNKKQSFVFLDMYFFA